MVLKCNASLEKNAKPREPLVPHEMGALGKQNPPTWFVKTDMIL